MLALKSKYLSVAFKPNYLHGSSGGVRDQNSPLSTWCLQAKDERFVSARVEFDAASLKPTYKLLWGEAGESQALAVAEGLGFDRDIVAQAHEIARTGNLGGQQGEPFPRSSCLVSILLAASLGCAPDDHPPQGPFSQRRITSRNKHCQ